MADQQTTARQRLTATLHAHTCHPDGETCAWAGEDPGEGTCSDVGEVGIEDAVLGWVATLADDQEAVDGACRAVLHRWPADEPITSEDRAQVRVVIQSLASASTERGDDHV